MESYNGLAILTTNAKDALDATFLRRLRFVVQFPFPDLRLRTELWRRAIPDDAPRAGLDVGKLARLQRTARTSIASRLTRRSTRRVKIRR
jgi:SpoVK/Ycf46/Vps4 family AAA+-type ATPase